MILPYQSISFSTKYQTGHASVITTFTVYIFNCLISYMFCLHFVTIAYSPVAVQITQVGPIKNFYYKSLTRLVSN